jgi:hypothetical protein
LSPHHPCIADLEEESPVGPDQVDVLRTERVVGVAQEEYGLGVDLLGEQKLGEQPVRARGDRIVVHGRIAADIAVLGEGPQEAAGVEVVDEPPAHQVRRVDPPAFLRQALQHVAEAEVEVSSQPQLGLLAVRPFGRRSASASAAG